MFDSLIFPSHLVEKSEELLPIFDAISGGRLFGNNINYLYHYSQGTVYPFWFKHQEGCTLGEWIVANFETHIIDCYMQHLLHSKDSFRKNYPLEHQKQIRKYWKSLSLVERETLVKEQVENNSATHEGSNREERRRAKIFNLVTSLSPVATLKVLDPEPDSKELALNYFRSLDDTSFIDSLLFPTLEQVASVPRLSLHSLGRLVYKRINDINFEKLVIQLEEKKAVVEIKSNKTTSKKKSLTKRTSQKGSNGQPTTPQGELVDSPESDFNKPLALDLEMKLVTQEFASGDGSEWFCSGTNSHSNHYRNKGKRQKEKGDKVKTSSNEFNVASAISGGPIGSSSDNNKAQSLHGITRAEPEVKRTYSTTNNLHIDDLNTTSNNRTLSTKTEEKMRPAQPLTKQHSRPEGEVREEDDLSAEDTISRTSNRGSVDHNNANSSVDHKKNNLRTNSIERDVKKKLAASNNRLFKQLQKNGDPPKKEVGGHLVSGNKAQLVSLYSNHDIKEIMNNCEVKRIIRPARTSAVNPSKTANSPRVDPDTKIPKYIELRKGSSNQKPDEPISPLIPKVIEKTPPSKKPTDSKKAIYSTVINKLTKWENQDSADTPENIPITLDFDGVEVALKPDINKGFQKYLSVPMTLEQGELFFKNYLSYSVNECVSKIKVTTKSYEPLRITAFRRIRNVITQSFKAIKSTLLIYGSWVTGLMIDSSDIDLCIKRYEALERNEIKNILETLEHCFRAFKWVVEVKGIYTAYVPVLKLVGILLNRSLILQ